MKTLRPMLAGKAPEDLEALRFPLIGSPKLDGIRCLIKDGVALSRTLKPIRNRLVQQLLGRSEFSGLDGELIVGSPTDPNCMQATTSGVMSADGEPNFSFFVFDRWDRGHTPYVQVVSHLMSLEAPAFIKAHKTFLIDSVPELESIETDVLSMGYEGLILRAPDGPYKFNRSTTREGWMLKLKRFAQDEAMVTNVEQLYHNDNDLTLDERGYAKRSSHQENLIPSGKLGALVCRDLKTGATFNIGTGFSDLQRRALWADRANLVGRIVSYKHFAQQGVLEAPRHPVFVAFRDKRDIS